MYKLNKDRRTGEDCSVNRANGDGTVTSIPFAPDNTDYQTFKKEVLAGAELQDADENVMTDAKAYVATLP